MTWRTMLIACAAYLLGVTTTLVIRRPEKGPPSRAFLGKSEDRQRLLGGEPVAAPAPSANALTSPPPPPAPTIPPSLPGPSSMPVQMRPYVALARAIYPEVADPHSPISNASREIISEWSARPNLKPVLVLPTAPMVVAIEAARRSSVTPKNFAEIRTAQGLKVQILAIYKRREDKHIVAFYGLNTDETAWALSASEAVGQVQRGTRSFFSQDAGNPVDIIAAQSLSGDYYLKTTVDGEEPATLLSLPNLATP